MAVAGIEISLVEDRGHVILVVEEGAMNSLTEDINQLKMDLIGDGWSVTPLTVAKTLSGMCFGRSICSCLALSCKILIDIIIL